MNRTIPSATSRLSQLAWTVAAFVLLTRPLSADDGSRAEMPAPHRSLLERHCFSCHGAETQEGSVRLDDLPLAIADVQSQGVSP